MKICGYCGQHNWERPKDGPWECWNCHAVLDDGKRVTYEPATSGNNKTKAKHVEYSGDYSDHVGDG